MKTQKSKTFHKENYVTDFEELKAHLTTVSKRLEKMDQSKGIEKKLDKKIEDLVERPKYKIS